MKAMTTIDSYQELTDVFNDPPTQTIDPLIDWPRFWKLLDTAYNDDRRMKNLRIAEWLLSNMAFGDGGAQMAAK